MFEPRELHCPYPGLRPFDACELPLFFGREAHVSRLIEILHSKRFLSVVGPSGSGKSSLVRAGLLPALAMGWPGELSDWRMAIMRPGDRPLRRLAEALLRPDVLGTELGALAYGEQGQVSEPANLPALIEGALRGRAQALADLVTDADRHRGPQPAFNLLVLVDQFEELFRFADQGQRQVDEAEAFVQLLLAAARAGQGAALRIHVVLTMRTDALHECARFMDLPEAINQGQYLVPRLKQDELRRAITEPARVFEGQVQPEVVDLLVRQVQNAPDELPMLQHALSRMWHSASQRNAAHPRINPDDLATSGGVDAALSKHANEIFNSLPPDQQALADVLLRAITGRADGNQADTRRPQRLGAIATFAGLPASEWPRFEPVLRAFAAEGANFLSFGEPLGPDTVVDISHEALIRQWDRLRALAAWEAELADQYRRWRNRCDDHRTRGGTLLEGADLAAALAWQGGQGEADPVCGRLAHGGGTQGADGAGGGDSGNVARPFAPHAGWAARYALAGAPGLQTDEFEALAAFIAESQAEDERRRQEREREAQARLALDEQVRQAQLDAERERREAAEKQQRTAEDGRRRAQKLLILAILVAVMALVASWLAWSYKQRAIDAADRATRQKGIAEANETKAKTQAIVAATAASRAIAAEAAASQALVQAQVRTTEAQLAASQALAAKTEARTAEGKALSAAADARAAFKSSTALRLAAEGQAMDNLVRPGGTERGWQQVLAAHRLQPGVEPYVALQSAFKHSSRLLRLRSSSARVLAVAFSPDSTRIVSASADNTLQLWDAHSVAPIGEPLKGHSGTVNSVAFSPDGGRIVSGSDDLKLRLWDAHTGAPVGEPLKGHFARVTSVAFSPDGARIVSGSDDHTLRLWDARTGAPVGEPLKGHFDCVTSVAFSPDGTRIVSGSYDSTLRLWDARTGAPIGESLNGHFDRVTSVAFSPDGTRIVSGSWDSTLRLWDARTGAPIGEPLKGHFDRVTSVAFGLDGTRIVSGSDDHTLRLWDARSGAPIGNPYTGHADKVNNVAFSPDGTRIVSGSDDETLRLWDARTGAPILEPLKGHLSAVFSAAFSPDGARIVSGSRDNTLRLWDARTGAPVGEPLKGHSAVVLSVAFSPDGARIVSGSSDKTLRLWDARTGASIGEPLKGHSDLVNSVAFSPDGARIVSGSSDKTLRLWEARTGAPIGEPLKGHSAVVLSVAFSPDGMRMASGSGDKTLRLWDARTGAPIGEPLKGHSGAVKSVAFSPDGARIVSGSYDNTLRLWDARAGAPIGEPLQGHSEWVNSVAFSPDGKHIVSGSWDNMLRLWDARTGAPIGEPLKGQYEVVNSVAFSPDSKRIVSGSTDKTLGLWPVLEGWADALCQKLSQNMTREQWRQWVGDLPYRRQCPNLPGPPDEPDAKAAHPTP
jgi:WD40 repeat protein